jgi:DNA gyrase subunit A
MPVVDLISLQETAQSRYLNYALSVITSRALPDIRDGLKPVQRRILYAMFANLHLYPEARYKKSATIVGETMGKYHPHGDSAIYEAMVRMAQDFSLRAPLVEGHGNFGSLDGDNPAAMRYTEARLRPLAMELLEELRKRTVDFRPNFDGSLSEPVVLPGRFPNLLVNGSSGIAVGMATNIPPHNLGEVVDALVWLIDHPDTPLETVVRKFIKGPDFPTGGRILNTPTTLEALYAKGEGAIELRGEYKSEGKTHLVIQSIPYGIDKSVLVEEIGEHIVKEKVPQLVDVRDESTDVVRIVLELRRGADPDAAMAYLFKHTSLQTRFHTNLTCLVPTEHPEVCTPARVDLLTVLRQFLGFRMEVVTRRLRYDLEQLEQRIHILRGFEKIFGVLDEVLKLIRSANDKADAGQRLMHRFGLDEVQVEAILEMKLYKLSRLEIDAIREELAEKERLAAALRLLLEDEAARWRLIQQELRELRKRFATDRRTVIAGPDQIFSYDAEDYIIAEDVYVIVTRDGWVKRQRSYTDLQNIRIREGDEVGWVMPGSTRATVCFMTNFGKAYTCRVDTLPQTTGYGDPVQKYFDFTDKERVVGVIVFDERILPKSLAEPDASMGLFGEEDLESGTPVAGPFFVAVTARGMVVRLPIQGYLEPSTKNGRLFVRLERGDAVTGTITTDGDENLCLASQQGYALIFPVRQIPVFKSAAKGVIAMRLGPQDRVLGFTLSSAARQGLEVETTRGRREIIRTTKFEVSRRGNKGRQIIQRGSLSKVIIPALEIRLNGH